MSTRLQTQAKGAGASAITHARDGLLQRKCGCGTHTIAGAECGACKDERNARLQRSATSASEVSGVPPVVHDVLRTPGQPLDLTTRAFFEPRFGHDFSRVRVHTDGQAAESASAVNALAYTVGRDIAFGAGQYAPKTATGNRLLAHELAHTIQQGQAVRPYPEKISVTHREEPAEREADAIADAVTRGEQFDARVGGGIRLARQDAGTPDAATADGGAGPAPDAGTTAPDAGAPAPPGGVGGPGPGPPAPAPLAPVNLLRVEVHPNHRGHFPSIPSTGAGTHWVGVASATAPKPVVRAVVDPAVPGTDPAVAGLTWAGPGVTPDPGNPLQAEVDRMAGRRPVTATLNGVSRSTTVWAVFARIRTTTGPTQNFASNAVRARPGAATNFDATIHPASILTDPDRPVLDGPNDGAPPGGTHIPSGNPLAGGADHHWDFSRKSRVRLINPSGIALPTLVVPGDTPAANIFAGAPWGYPATWEEGNDDSATGDENNNPYASAMTSNDTPGVQISHAGGANGDTFEIRVHFLEFVRLELARAWWVISQMFPWRVHMRVRKAAGRWVDDTTDAAADNAGF